MLKKNQNTIETLTEKGKEKVRELADRHQLSEETVTTMLRALVNGNGTMAQFNIPELGGSGQWMKGGMTMVGDMFNNQLKARVDALCQDLTALLQHAEFFQRTTQTRTILSDHWWPAGLGNPSSSGAQNNFRYAYFADTARLVLDNNGQITIYDTLDHRIGGVSQQQGNSQDLQFTSQYGRIDLRQLPVVSGSPAPPASTAKPEPASSSSNDIFQMIEKLAALREKGILSEEEFNKKKNELLGRL